MVASIFVVLNHEAICPSQYLTRVVGKLRPRKARFMYVSEASFIVIGFKRALVL